MNLLKANDDNHSFTGGVAQSDTTVVSVPISIIKEANVKLHERIILKDIVMNLEEQVEDCKKVIESLHTTIDSLYTHIQKDNNIINSLKDDKKILKGIIGVETIALIIVSIILITN